MPARKMKQTDVPDTAEEETPKNESANASTLEPTKQSGAQLLGQLNSEVKCTGAAFDEAHRGRETHQKKLNEMLEATLRQIQKSRSHMLQQAGKVRLTTKSFSTKFEHDFACMRDELKKEFVERGTVIDKSLDGLDERMDALEKDLETQRQARVKQTQEILQPISDQVMRLADSLEAERRARQLEEEGRERLLAHSVEEITRLLDAEKFAREQQVAEFNSSTDSAQQSLAKRQYQAETEIGDKLRVTRTALEQATKERILDQNGVVESIASFVRRYREQVSKETDFYSHPVGGEPVA